MKSLLSGFMKEHTLLNKSLLHHGRIIDLYSETVLVEGKEHTYDVVEHKGAVVLLPITNAGTILLVSQWRQAIKERTIELPAGVLEDGEDRMAAAIRECQEEIGYKPKKVTPFLELITTPGFTNERLFVYLAEELIPSKLDGDETEDIEIIEMTEQDIQKAIDEGRINDMKTLAVFYHYLLRKK